VVNVRTVPENVEQMSLIPEDIISDLAQNAGSILKKMYMSTGEYRSSIRGEQGRLDRPVAEEGLV
jgi:hypothetical protein